MILPSYVFSEIVQLDVAILRQQAICFNFPGQIGGVGQDIIHGRNIWRRRADPQASLALKSPRCRRRRSEMVKTSMKLDHLKNCFGRMCFLRPQNDGP